MNSKGSTPTNPLANFWSGSLVLFALCAGLPNAPAQSRTRTELFFPDLPGYVTLRCDFHMHTVFSDGYVWPSVRVEEAWRDGLDVIAMTDHLEYLPHKNDVVTNYSRSYEIARAAARPLGLTVIRAAEITKGEPPGHLNALFVTNAAELRQDDCRVAVQRAIEQGAFVFWNHPGWKQPQGKSVWYAAQDEFYTNGWLKGIEIVNGPDYDPIAYEWCVEKHLAILGDSDVHDPIGMEYGGAPGSRRPITLIFATSRSPEAIREALLARRTAVFSNGHLMGDAAWLEPIFQGSCEILNRDIRIRGRSEVLLQIRNRAPLDFEIRLNPKLPELDVASKPFVLAAQRVSLIRVACISDRVRGEQEIALPCRVLNLMTAPEKALRTALRVRVNFEPADASR